MKKTILLLTTFTLYFSVFTSFGQTSVSAIISSDQIWDVAGSPYLFSQNTQVEQGVSVTVMPGVMLESSGGAYYVQVLGELKILGVSDSLVTINNLELAFTSFATPYNPIDQSGCQIRYADIQNFSNRINTIRCQNKSFLMENSTVYTDKVAFEANYQVMDSSYLYLNHCHFLGSSTNSRRIFSVGNTRRNYEIRNCIFENAAQMDVGGSGLFLENEVREIVVLRFLSYGSITVKCNSFSRHHNGMEVASLGGDIDFNHNTIDSSGHSSGASHFPMMFITTDSAMMETVDLISFRYNNILTNLSQNEKVRMNHGFGPATQNYTVDLKQNYWVSSDSNSIAAMVKDAHDDSSLAS